MGEASLLPTARPELGKPSRFLVLVKTYPSPSKKYGETVCCAGLDDERRWIRMYPVNFRSLEQYGRFSKWQFIEATWEPSHDDSRPESRRIHQDTIRAGEKVGSADRWARRRSWIDPIVDPSLEFLWKEQGRSQRSLGIIRPAKVLGLDIVPTSWDTSSRRVLDQLALAWTGLTSPTTDLEIIPFDFVYRFRCDNTACKGHRMEIFDWEAGASYRRFRRRYGRLGWETKFRDKWERELPSRDLHLVVGTHHQFGNWLIVGVLYPPHVKVREGEAVARQRIREKGAMTIPLFGFEAQQRNDL